jgi:EmrB/QacA subfamily drug resistance transporter
MHDLDPLRWKALVLLCAVDLMVILDSQIVIVALPTLGPDLGFSEDGAQWVLSAYLLAFGGLLMLGGRAGDLLGRRRVFLAGTALFAVASLACGLAGSPGFLVAARVVHGVSAALMAPTALAILVTTFEDDAERTRALATWGAVGGVGATLALLVGGVLTEAAGWRSIFFINVPIALLVLALAPVLLRESRAPARRAFDVLGAVTLTLALVALLYAVVEAPDAGWGAPRTLALLGAAVALGAAFLAVERRSAAPLVPLGLLRTPRLAGGNLVMLLAGMAAWGVGLAGSLYGQGVLGMTPLEYGLGTTVFTVGAVAGSFAAERLVPRVGVGTVAAVGAAFLGVGALLLTAPSDDGSYVTDLLPGFAVFGPGLGATTVAASIAALGSVPEEHSGVASGTNTAAFQLGGALGSAIVTTVVVSSGLGAGFGASVIYAALAAAVALLLLRRAPGGPSTSRPAPGPGPG